MIVQQLLQDVQYAARTLRRNPGFAAVAILTFALGIGANTAMFSLLDAIVLRSLPVSEPQQLFLLNEINPREQGPAALSWPGFERLRQSLPAGARMVALAGPARFNMTTDGGGMEPIYGQLVSGGYFDVLGVRAAIGRTLNEGDNRRLAGSPVAVLSHSAWIRRFGGDHGVIGRILRMNGAAMTIVGVTEADFYGVSLGESPDVWLPLMMQNEVRFLQNVASHNGDTSKPWLPQENLYWLRALLRVAPPASETSVMAALQVAFEHEQQLGQRQSGLPRDRRLALEPGARGFTSFRTRLATPLKVLSGMVALVLVIACTNIASLVLTRGSARRREFAIRLSLGASRIRLLRQLLTENLVLSVTGGSLGLLLAVWAMPVLPHLFAVPVTLHLDHRLLIFAAAVSLATGLLFGSIPALRGTAADHSALKSGGSASSHRRGQVLGKGLVVSQVALSFVLVTGAVLLGTSLLKLMHTDLGFDREHILTIVLDVQSAGLQPRQLPALYDRLVDSVKATPGVRDATISLSSLAGGGQRSSGIHVPGYVPQPSERPGTVENFVAPGYFTIMGMRLLQGRDFDRRDGADGLPVAIVNEAFARRYFAGRNPLGRRFGYNSGHSGFEIIGVIADARTVNPKEPARPMAYRPLAQEMLHARSLEVLTAGDPRAQISQLRKVISDVAPDLPIIEITTLSDRVERTLNQERLLGQLTSFFAVFALLLACMGVYGLVSYGVSRRTAEFGLRMALGARNIQVVWIVLVESLLLLGIGLAIGLGLSIAGARVVQSLLFGLSANDPKILALAALVTSLVTILAACLPARRAARINPSVALRHE